MVKPKTKKQFIGVGDDKIDRMSPKAMMKYLFGLSEEKYAELMNAVDASPEKMAIEGRYYRVMQAQQALCGMIVEYYFEPLLQRHEIIKQVRNKKDGNK